MKSVTRVVVAVGGGVLALTVAAPAQAASQSQRSGGHGKGVSVTTSTTPKTCTKIYSEFAQRKVTACKEGWGYTKKIKHRGTLQVFKASQTTLVVTAPGYYFKDVDDVRSFHLYRKGKLTYAREFSGVTYTIAGRDCVISTEKVIKGGKTHVTSVNTCGAAPSAAS